MITHLEVLIVKSSLAGLAATFVTIICRVRRPFTTQHTCLRPVGKYAGIFNRQAVELHNHGMCDYPTVIGTADAAIYTLSGQWILHKFPGLKLKVPRWAIWHMHGQHA